MICVQQDAQGVVSIINPQPADLSACTAVLVSPGELSVPWAISLEDGGAISLAIVAVWAVGWAFRQFARVLQSTDEVSHESF